MATKNETNDTQQTATLETGEAEKIIGSAKDEAARILAAARKEAEQVAAQSAEAADDTRPAPSGVDPGEELVQIRLFKDGEKYKDDVFVAVNGERMQIRRGEDVRIKRKFAQVLEQSIQQDSTTARQIEEASSEYSRKVAALGL